MSDLIKPYSQEKLPSGFLYPTEFLELICSNNIDIQPWWFVSSEGEAGELFLKVCLGNGQNLVPFAKTDIYDDIACFDGTDISGNPKIIMKCSTPDRHYEFDCFSSWLLQVEKDISLYGGS